MSDRNLDQLTQRLLAGVCIPAHPLALDSERRLDVRRQRGLTRYYLDSGATGLAVGVHTTQFAIRDAKFSLLVRVLELAATTAREHALRHNPNEQPLLIAGVCGQTEQAVSEASLARDLGYQAVLLSLAALAQESDQDLLRHARAVGNVMPIVGFYLQPAVGGRLLSFDFWREFAEIPEVVAIKVAPFNRYQTLDVVRAVAESSRWQSISLLTGNDDTILHDLLSRYEFTVEGTSRAVRFSGGLLGHWACWTQSSVRWFRQCIEVRDSNDARGLHNLLMLASQITDMNAAIFDAKHHYRGCIAGIHEVLCRQGLLAGTWCLEPNEGLSPGQAEEISRVTQNYPDLVDDAFIRQNIDHWLAD